MEKHKFVATMRFGTTIEAESWEEAYEIFMDNLREYHLDTIEWVEVE